MKTVILMAALAMIGSLTAQANIPTSARSKEAIARVKPALEKELGEKGLSFGSPIYVRIFKEEKELEMWVKKGGEFVLFKIYAVSTNGGQGLGTKLRQGDGKAPEGFYFVTPDKLNPSSDYHLAFNVGYPNGYDSHHGRTGSAIMVHGRTVSIGCYAMTDPFIEEIYALADGALRNGQSFFRVHIFPFRMTDDNLEKHKDSEWSDFWKNLKEGYDKFSEYGNNPPNIQVSAGKYVFNRE
jgi:murein L,D-transpeptidase YafK